MNDDELIACFPPPVFGHREHVRLAFALLSRFDFAEAAARYRDMLRRVGGAKDHETITWAYLAVIAERMHGRTYADSHALLADHPDLLDHRSGALAGYYDVAAITASPLARAVFVLPKRA